MKRKRRAAGGASSSDDEEDDDDATKQQYRKMCRAVYVTSDNHVHFRWECTAESLLRLESCVRQAVEQTPIHSDVATVHLHVESCGGDAAATLRLYDWLTALPRVRVITWVEGYVASAATVLALAGEERRMLPSAVMMVHEVFSESSDNTRMRCTEAQDDVAYTRMLTNRLVDIYSARSGVDRGAIAQLLRRDVPLSQTDALRIGFVTDATSANRPAAATASETRTSFVRQLLNDASSAPNA